MANFNVARYEKSEVICFCFLFNGNYEFVVFKRDQDLQQFFQNCQSVFLKISTIEVI
jgi:hypothetical protein